MRVLLTGGAACGKSAYAEDLATRLSGPRFYIATLRPWDDECLRRIERHRRARAEKGFETIECPDTLAALRLPARGTALLECLGTLCANEMFPLEGPPRDPVEIIARGVAALEAQCAHLLVVTNEVGADGGAYSAETQAYIAALGTLNAKLAARFDCVYELVCGIPLVRKGRLL